MGMRQVKTGLDRLQVKGAACLRGQRVGLLAHPASIDGSWRHALEVLLELELNVTALFGPQHGWTGHTQDNMVEWESFRDARMNIPVHSLYGDIRKPDPSMLEDVDTLVVDLQDVGARYYTFVWSMLLCMQACAEQGKRVLVLDRPNPINGVQVEGPDLRPDHVSFVGMAPIPVRHGLTMGEMAMGFVQTFHLDLDLEIQWMEGWSRELWFDETGLPFVMPSPNMPTLDTATVYPGACLLEGTHLSEGRGTTRPFEIIGAPNLPVRPLLAALKRWDLPGVHFRAVGFQPTHQKWAGRVCDGVQVHVTDRRVFQPLLTYAAVLREVAELEACDPLFRDPPYEYEFEKLPIDILAGGPDLRMMIGQRASQDVFRSWASLRTVVDRWPQPALHYGWRCP